MTELPEGLVRWAAMAGPASVLDAVRGRARRGHSIERGTLRVDLPPDRRREVARLLGTAWDVSGRPVSLQRLAAALAENGLTVRRFVEVLDGRPLVDERAVRAAFRRGAADEFAATVALVTSFGVAPATAEFWARDQGLPRAGAGHLLALAEQVARLWPNLPWHRHPAIRIARLAAAELDGAHDLDHGTELGRAAVRLVALHLGLPRPLRPGREWRQAWAAAGVLCDEVSSRVLVLNLPLRGTAPAARLCTATRGEPVWLTLRSLAGEWTVEGGTVVHVCENPTVVEAAADAFGPACPAMVCTDGVPTLAVLDLVAGLDDAGARLRVRADVDENGFVTVEQVLSVAPKAELWQFDVASYADHHQPLDAWSAADDPTRRVAQLRAAFANSRLPLHEEAVLDELLADLERTVVR